MFFSIINIKYINPNLEKKLTIPIGFFSGIIGGLSTMYSPYVLAYLVSVNLEKETLIRREIPIIINT